MAKREFSAGGIVLKRGKKNFKILLIKDPYGRWTWPKGHINQSEKSKDAALREITEEVGLRNISILRRIGRANYFYRLKGELIFKTVFYFLVETTGTERFKVQKSEIKDARWFKSEAALKAVGYKGAKELLKKAIKIYKMEKRCSG